MPLFAAGAAPGKLSVILSSWQMSFTSVHFLLFLPLAVGGSFVLPKRLRRAWLLLCSYYFYFFAAPKYLVVLLAGTAGSWLLGLLVAGGKSPAAKKRRLFFSVALMVLFLAFFKYNGFFAGFLSPFFARLGISYASGYFITAGALGISFYTFTVIGYLIDVAAGEAPPERNLLTYALFIGFFPSVTMGPISRAGGLLPQLRVNGIRFDAQNAADALRDMAMGFFKKLAVADTLAVITGAIYADLSRYSGLTLTLAAVLFALQLYFDFSGYSDIAIGCAKLLGIKLPQNFQNPYFATNYSSFWQRWHISLSSWLQDYIFTPVVWSRWTEKLPVLGRRVKKPPVLSAIAVTFLISGIWHGDTLCFVLWGALMAAFRIGEELLHRVAGKPKKNPSLPVRIGKTAVVLVLWVESLVFFKAGMSTTAATGLPLTVGDALSALGRQFTGVSLSQTASDVAEAVRLGFFPKTIMVAAFLGFTLVCLAAALYADWVQCFRLGGAPFSTGLKALRPLPRWCLYYGLVLCCFAALIAQAGGNFLYGGF